MLTNNNDSYSTIEIEFRITLGQWYSTDMLRDRQGVPREMSDIYNYAGKKYLKQYFISLYFIFVLSVPRTKKA